MAGATATGPPCSYSGTLHNYAAILLAGFHLRRGAQGTKQLNFHPKLPQLPPPPPPRYCHNYEDYPPLAYSHVINELLPPPPPPPKTKFLDETLIGDLYNKVTFPLQPISQLGGHIQTILEKINVIMTLGGEGV